MAGAPTSECRCAAGQSPTTCRSGSPAISAPAPSARSSGTATAAGSRSRRTRRHRTPGTAAGVAVTARSLGRILLRRLLALFLRRAGGGDFIDPGKKGRALAPDLDRQRIEGIMQPLEFRRNERLDERF